MFPIDTHIAIIDDCKKTREQITKALGKMGYYSFSHFADGSEVLCSIEADPRNNSFGLFICDWNMPKMDGLSLLQKLRKMSQYNSAPFIMLTAKSEMESVLEAINQGVDQYIVKPIDRKSLGQKLLSAWSRVQQKKAN